MNARSSRDRAAIWLGALSIFSLVFVYFNLRELHFIQIPRTGVWVAVVLGLLAILAGWLANRLLLLLAGAGFVAAAAVQLTLHTLASPLVQGSTGATFGLWLGLGAALLALALTPAAPGAPEPDPRPR